VQPAVGHQGDADHLSFENGRGQGQVFWLLNGLQQG
jgi:hypothetical protein